MDDTLAELVDQVRELRREVRGQGATLVLLLEAVRGQGVRVASLERVRLTPIPDERGGP